MIINESTNAFMLSQLVNQIEQQAALIYVDLPFLKNNPEKIEQILSISSKSDAQFIGLTNFNHLNECTDSAKHALNQLADRGWILSNTTYLISDYNDSVEQIKNLNLELLKLRVRPYALINDQDQTNCTNTDQALNIIEKLRGWTSGLAVPHLLIKKQNFLQHKLPQYIVSEMNEQFVFRNYKNHEYNYTNKPHSKI